MPNVNKILIVEDEVMPALALKAALEKRGFAIVGMLARGEKVSETVEREKPDLVLVDIRLAGAYTGVEVVEMLKRSSPVPFIYMSGYDFGPLHEAALATEPLAFLSKPVDIDKLVEIIERHLPG